MGEAGGGCPVRVLPADDLQDGMQLGRLFFYPVTGGQLRPAATHSKTLIDIIAALLRGAAAPLRRR